MPAKEEVAIAETLGLLGTIHYEAGELTQAAQCFERAVAIRERALGPDALPTAVALNDLAMVRLREGDSVRAEPLLERGLDIRRKRLGASHPEVAASMNNLAEIYLTRGDYGRAKPLLEGAVAIQGPIAEKEQPPGPASVTLARFLNNLGRLHMAQDDYRGAEAPLLRSLDVREKSLAPIHPDIARALNALGSMYQQRGELDRAEPYYVRALGIYEKGAGPNNVVVAPAVNNLAVLYLLKGDFERARPLYVRALEIRERNLGSRHPQVAVSLAAIAVFYQLTGDAEKAVDAQRRSMEIGDQNASAILATGSEQQKLQYADTMQESSDITLWMRQHFATSRSALDLAVTTVLRRKGRVLDAMVDVSANLRRTLDPAGQQLFDQLSAARAELARLAFQGPRNGAREAHETAMTTAAAEIERLERLLSQKGSAAAGETRTIGVADVQRLLPADAQLVEFVRYRPFDPRATKIAERFGPARFAAFVLRKEGEPRWFELGAADEVDKRVAALRASLRSASRTDVKTLARAVDDLVMRPLRQGEADPRHIIVSPDASLNLIPFGALVDEKDRYLIERYEITYVTSGRDLLRLQHSQRAQRPPLVIADPAFDLAGASSGPSASGSRSTEALAKGFAPLPGYSGGSESPGEAAARRRSRHRREGQRGGRQGGARSQRPAHRQPRILLRSGARRCHRSRVTWLDGSEPDSVADVSAPSIGARAGGGERPEGRRRRGRPAHGHRSGEPGSVRHEAGRSVSVRDGCWRGAQRRGRSGTAAGVRHGGRGKHRHEPLAGQRRGHERSHGRLLRAPAERAGPRGKLAGSADADAAQSREGRTRSTGRASLSPDNGPGSIRRRSSRDRSRKAGTRSERRQAPAPKLSYARLRKRRPIIPTAPTPSSSAVDGSGTEAGGGGEPVVTLKVMRAPSGMLFPWISARIPT